MHRHRRVSSNAFTRTAIRNHRQELRKKLKAIGIRSEKINEDQLVEADKSVERFRGASPQNPHQVPEPDEPPDVKNGIEFLLFRHERPGLPAGDEIVGVDWPDFSVIEEFPESAGVHICSDYEGDLIPQDNVQEKKNRVPAPITSTPSKGGGPVVAFEDKLKVVCVESPKLEVQSGASSVIEVRRSPKEEPEVVSVTLPCSDVIEEFEPPYSTPARIMCAARVRLAGDVTLQPYEYPRDPLEIFF